MCRSCEKLVVFTHCTYSTTLPEHLLSLQHRVESITKSTTDLNGNDPAALIELQEQFLEFIHEAVAKELETAVLQASKCSEVLGQLVMREVEVEKAIKTVYQSVEYIQEAVDSYIKGERISEFVEVDEKENSIANPIDKELLDEWLSSCFSLLNEVEAHSLEMERNDDSENLITEIKRHLHTLKGECGVLSLAVAQNFCHKSESLIESEAEVGKPFPVDTILELVDWFKQYASQLSDDPNSLPPDSTTLEGLLNITKISDETEFKQVVPEQQKTIQISPENVQAEDDILVDFLLEGERDENLSDFICESREHIAAAEEALLELEQDFTDIELINCVFRAFHTVKGVAGFLSLEPIVRLAHSAEFLLDEARKGDITLNSAYLNLILQSCDMLSTLLSALDDQEPPRRNQLESLLVALEEALIHAPNDSILEGSTQESTQNPSNKGVSSESATGVISSDSVDPVSTQDPIAETSKIAAKREGIRKKADVTVKVNTIRLDNLVTMVGELVIAQQMVLQDENTKTISDQRFQRNLVHTGKIIRDLQEVAMSLRMVTVKGTFQKMARLVRDVAIRAEKQIHFHMEGEDTELDRTVVEEIGDPLVHIIRNACDHGIETPADRVAVGKTPTGNLTLRAYHQGGSIMIELEDDGKGLDRNRILKKAVEQGLVPADRDHGSMPDNEVFNLIMLPGFSTAEQVTDISGRGVGMDVVRRNIEALRGKLEIDSVIGKGTKFRMALPLTLAIIDGMVVQVGQQRYVIPTLAIERSYRPTEGELHTVAGRGEMASVRGALLPIYRLTKLFDIPDGIENPSDALLIVIERNDLRFCLVVDKIIGQQQVVIKSLGEGVSSQPGVSGGAILGDGRVALIIDVGGLMAQSIRNNEKNLQVV